MRRDQSLPELCPPLAMLDSREATWLRAVFRTALNAALASSLGIVACASDDEAACTEFKPLLLSELKPASRFDYASLRVAYLMGSPGMMRATNGEPCSGAQDREICEAALATIADDLERSETCGMIRDCRRYLVTTTGDEVKRYASREELLSFLGPIDAPEDARLLLDYDGFTVECEDAHAKRTDQGFVVEAVLLLDSCPVRSARVTLQVNPDGIVKELAREELSTGNTNVCIGRRPAGLIASNTPRTRSALGDHFAAMAQLEAASVTAFEVLAIELEHYRAPAQLIAAARAAAQDEVRHAESTARMARRFGVTPAEPCVEAHPLRTLDAMALDNATEGCVRETFGAMLGYYQAATAADAQIAALMHDLADDETRHAALALQIHHWVMPQLSAEVRAQIATACVEAARDLRRELDHQASDELCELAGVPDAVTAAKLHASVSRVLWQAQRALGERASHIVAASLI
jgi:hypothetical protein